MKMQIMCWDIIKAKVSSPLDVIKNPLVLLIGKARGFYVITLMLISNYRYVPLELHDLKGQPSC